MKKYSICLGRQFGSGGSYIAKKLSERLKIKFCDYEIISATARESGWNPDIIEKMDEKCNHGLLSAFKGYLCQEKIFGMQSETILKLAKQESCIFVGRCANYVLRNEENMLSVFITARRRDRISRIAKRLDISEPEAKTLVERTDKNRSNYYSSFTMKEWGLASSYNLCLNTTSFNLDETVDILERIIRDKFKDEQEL